MAIVIAKPIANVTSFGCAESMFRSLCFIVDMFVGGNLARYIIYIDRFYDFSSHVCNKGV
jgi:hypothetical protein